MSFFTAAVAAASGGLLLESTLSSSPSGSASPRRPALHLSAKVANNTSSPTSPNSSGNVSDDPYWVSQSLYPCPSGSSTLLWGSTSLSDFFIAPPAVSWLPRAGMHGIMVAAIDGYGDGAEPHGIGPAAHEDCCFYGPHSGRSSTGQPRTVSG